LSSILKKIFEKYFEREKSGEKTLYKRYFLPAPLFPKIPPPKSRNFLRQEGNFFSTAFFKSIPKRNTFS